MPDSPVQRASVLVLGGHRQGLAAARALGSAGWRVIYGRSADRGVPFPARSRWVHSIWSHPPIGSAPEEFAEALEEFLSLNAHVRLVFPIGDAEIVGLDAIRERLPATARPLMAARETLVTCRDKERLMRLAVELEVPVAAYQMVDNVVDLLRAVGDIGFPCVVKPHQESLRVFGGKAFIARDRDALVEALQRHGVPEGRLIVQAYVTGPRHNLYFFAEEGVIRAALQVRVVRTDRPDGTGYAVVGTTAPLSRDWLGHTRCLAARLRYTGPGVLQFVEEPSTGRSTLLEINPRLGGNHAFPEQCGLRLVPWWADLVHHGRTVIPEPFDYRTGVRYGWLYGSLSGVIDARSEPIASRPSWLRELAGLTEAAFVTRHITWNWRDPQPSLRLYAGLLKRTAARLMAHRNDPTGTLSGERPRRRGATP